MYLQDKEQQVGFLKKNIMKYLSQMVRLKQPPHISHISPYINKIPKT